MCLAVPGKIISIKTGGSMYAVGRVSFDGVIKDISLAYTPEARVGDYVIVHVGFALNILNQEEAQTVFKELEALEKAARE